MPRLLCVILAILLLSFPGCGLSRKKMDANAATHIHTIALIDVAVTRDRVYLDPAAMTMSGLLLGDIGTLAVDVATAAPQSQFQKALPDLAYPSRLLTEELDAALQRKGFTVRHIADGPPSYRAAVTGTGAMNDNLFVKDYSKVPTEGTDAVLDTVCVVFGYERFPFTQMDHPLISLAVRLVSPDGKVTYYVEGFAFAQKENHPNDCVSIDADRRQFTAQWSDVFKDPKLLDTQLRIAAKSLGDAIAHDIATGK